MALQVRPYQAEDLSSLYKICLYTGDGGQDASHLVNDTELMGHFYAAPYAFLNPEICFVACLHGKTCGYIVGCHSSSLFAQQSDERWFPALREQYPLGELSEDSFTENMHIMIHHGYQHRPEFSDYPAHLHINLLAEARRMGGGSKLLCAFIDKLKALNVAGVHLEVASSNSGARRFYEKMGFHAIAEFESFIAYGIKL